MRNWKLQTESCSRCRSTTSHFSVSLRINRLKLILKKEDTLDELADVIEQEEPVGTYLDGKEEMVSERKKLLESVSSCRSRIQSDLDKHNDMKKLLQEYEQEAKVQLAENKAMK